MRILPLLITSTLSLFSETYIINGSTIIGDIKQNNPSELTQKNIALSETFSKINLKLPATFVVNTQSDENRVQLELDKEIIDTIQVYVKQNQLYIHASKNIKTNLPIHVSIYSKEKIEDIQTEGSTNLLLNGSNQPRLHLDTQGISKIKVSSGDIGTLQINTEGSYRINFMKVQTQNASIQAKGIGKIKLNVSDNLEVKLSNMAKVDYHGQPQITQSLKGLSRLKQR